MQNTAPKIVYRFKDALYINLTNRCPNACAFCLKNKFSMKFEGYNLNLCGKEPSAGEVIRAAEFELGLQSAREIVFCGYGEPTMRLETLLAAAKELKKYKIPLRLNTVGLANLVYGRDVTGELAGVLDKVNISLNSPDKAQWLAIVRPQQKYAADAFESMQDFIRLTAQKMPPGSVALSIVDKQGIDVAAAQKLAQNLGAKLHVREYIDDK
ncbi:MAG: TatD family nuclease-associated radical SAM protein [Elusimicrobiota bacterium]|jgi:TatD family-associated radical SAM protein|nr:TatD family nuclease-associated radical SAM protein [Elusimicrobiota bacterium]